MGSILATKCFYHLLVENESYFPQGGKRPPCFLFLIKYFKFCLLREKQEIKTDFGQTLYWDYYLYVKENPITNWNKKTYILYGNEDNMQDENIIKNFSENFSCKLSILEDGEHYFHTEKQLDYYKNWLSKTII